MRTKEFKISSPLTVFNLTGSSHTHKAVIDSIELNETKTAYSKTIFYQIENELSLIPFQSIS